MYEMADMDVTALDVVIESTEPSELTAGLAVGERIAPPDTRMESERDEWEIDDETVEFVTNPSFEFLDDESDELFELGSNDWTAGHESLAGGLVT